MPNSMTFKVNLKVGNKKGFISEVERMLGGVKAGVSGGGSGKSGGVSGGGFLGGAMKGLGGTMAKMLGWVTVIGTAVSNLVKPIIGMLGMILKMIGEFLRPIADMVMILLMPILIILRPIVQMIRGMMAPFRAAAFKLAAAGGKAFAEGDYAKGGALFGLAFAALTEGFTNMLLGLIGDILKIIVDLAAWIVKVVGGIVFDIAIAISKLLDKILPGDQSGFTDSLERAKKLLVGSEKTKGAIDIMADKAKKGIDDAIAWINGQTLKGITKSAGLLGVHIDSFGTVVGKLDTAADDLQTFVDKQNTGGVVPYLPGMSPKEQAATAEASTGVGVGGFGFGLGRATIANVASGGNKDKYDSLMEGLQDNFLEGFTHINDDVTSYMSPDEGKIPTMIGNGLGMMAGTFDAFNIATKGKFKTFIGPKGTIPNLMNNGFSEMSDSSNTFAKAMGKAAQEVRAAVDAALASAARAHDAKQRYERAIERLKDKRSD